MDIADSNGRGGHSSRRCANCGSALAHDQRYCLTCGTRRGPLPAPVESTLHEMQAGPDSTPEPAAPPPEPPRPGRQLPTPRVASLAVMAMLAFGVVAGSLSGPGGVEALAKTLVVSVAPPPATTPIAPASDSAGGGGSGGGDAGGGSQETITETITQPASTTSPGNTTPSSSSDTSTSGSSGADSGSAAVSLPPIKHVFLIMLSNQGYDQAFGTTAGHPYLASTLRKQGELLQDYYGVAPSPLANEIALLSGQGPTQDTATDCPVFTSLASTGNQGQQVLGNGCVYPATTVTLPDELTDNGNTWKAYIQGIDQGPAGTPKTCRRPDVGQPDPNQAVSPTDPYVTWTNPFVYFGSLTTGNACASDDIGLPQLAEDLKRARTTPNLAYIAPDPCDDGNDTPCMPGSPAGLGQADTFLKSVVPEIEASPAYKQDGMIVITFDQAPQSGPGADTSSCCDQPTFPNLSGAGATTTTGTTTTPATTTGATTSGTTNAATTTGTPTTTPTAPIPAGTTTTAAATTPATAPATTTTPTSCTTTTTTTTGTTSTGTTTTGTTTAGTTTGATTTGTTPSTSTTSSSTTPGVSTTPTTGTTTTTGTSTSPGCNSSGTPAGGGQVGALVISQYVKANTSDLTDTFNHFSLLKTIEGLFSIKELGYSKDASLPEFDASVFNDYTAG